MPQNILGFELEWFDPVSTLLHTIFMKYYLDDDTIELLHSKMKSQFLARIYYPEVKLTDMFVGNSITVFNRLLAVKGYCNDATRKFMEEREIHIMMTIRGKDIQAICDVMKSAMKYNFFTNRVKKIANDLKVINCDAKSLDLIVEFVSTETKDPTDADNFISEASSCIPDITSTIDTAVEITRIFEGVKVYKSKNPCTLCLIKPHILKDKMEGSVIKHIVDQGYEIDSLVSLHMNINMAEYLFEVYRGIFPKYTSMMEHIVSGPVLAIQISHPSLEVVPNFRELCGPLEPPLGQKILPDTIRAKFGSDVIRNAVHCTDLPEDGDTECTYIFQTLANI